MDRNNIMAAGFAFFASCLGVALVIAAVGAAKYLWTH